MERIVILNGSPRAPKSNSKCYADIFSKKYNKDIEYYNITKQNHDKLCSKMNDFSDMLLVFPLYADGIPATLLNFLSNYWLYFTIWNTSYYFIYCSFGWNNFILGIFRIYTK